MKKEFILKSKNKIIVKIGEIETQSGDAILNWTALNLNAGPDSFYKIHRQGGPQISSAISLISAHNIRFNTGDVFSTIPGMLDFNILLHGILPLPEETEVYETLLFNVIETLDTYKKQNNICRNLFITFPDILNNKKIIQGLLNYEYKLADFTFVFIVDEKIFQKTTALIETLTQGTLLQRIKKMFK